MQSAQQVNASLVLMFSLELAARSWKVAVTDGRRENPAVIKVEAEHRWKRLQDLLARLRELLRKWGLPESTPMAGLYEAGQDGFWIARALQAAGVQVQVVDAGSIPVPRKARRCKTDRLDALKLLNVLRAWLRGERGEVRMVHIPSEEAEAQRLLSRNRGLLQKEAGQHRDRMTKQLLLYGCAEELDGSFADRLAKGEVRCADGRELPQELVECLKLEWERLQLVQQQFVEVHKTLLPKLKPEVQRGVQAAMLLKGIGFVGAMRVNLELLWRDFQNRKQVGGCTGLVSQPYDSGESHTDQGISKQGNRRVRALLIEMAWMWLRYQPNSAITKWFVSRTTGANKRGKRIAIVAVARRLAIALWRWVRFGELPAGAELKPA